VRPVALAGLFALCTCTRGPTAAPVEARLLAEFDGTFARDPMVGSAVHEVELVAAEGKVSLYDGAPRTKVWAYGGTVPGPTLRVRLGETLKVRFKNRLPQPTTVHWHGVRVPNAMDGVPHLTQPPVEPGGEFTYEFTPREAGTFWFHPHLRSSEQVERGLYGVLIVDDVKPSPYDQDIVWVLDDWLLDGQGQVDGEFNTRHDLAHDGRWGGLVTVNGRTDTVMNVKSNQRVRLRLLNTANGRIFRPDFSGLEARVIAVDGNYTGRPLAPEGFELAPGNRLDVELRFDQPSSARLELYDRFVERRPNRLGTIVVDGVAEPGPQFSPRVRVKVPELRDWALAPIFHDFRLDARQGGPFGIEWTIDGRAFAGHEAHAHEPSLKLPLGRFTRLRFTNQSYRLHPIHLHGMFFRLLGRDGRSVDEPFFRDTVLMHPKEVIDIGVVPLDEGRWMMHCHILEHAEAGMMTTLDVGPVR
jgi:FtsP/CotA-like multicopper oxidase with cupredoxin domain